jgi:beta-carotene 3-hydroxylase
MNPFLIVLIISVAFVMMECIAWFTHKYLMHGPLWFIHQTHHKRKHGFFELNDIFGLAFGGLALWLIIDDILDFSWKFWTGCGITLYGIAYFITHDIFVHQRIKFLANTRNIYLLALRRAHKIHHKTIEKDHSSEFGFLFVKPAHFKYFQKKKNE